MARPLHALSDNLFGFDRPEPLGHAGFVRTLEALAALSCLYLAWSWAAYVPRIGDVAVPLGIAQYMDVRFLYGAPWKAAAVAALVTLGLAASFFRLASWAYLAVLAPLHLLYAARDVFGEISHSSNLVVMSLMGFGLALVLYRTEPDRRRFALGFTLFFVGFAYAIAAVAKFIGTGWLWPDGLHLWMWVTEKGIDTLAKDGVTGPNVVQRLVLGSRPLATAFLTVGLLTEATAWLVWLRRPRPYVLFGIAGMHVGIRLVMGITFVLSTLLVTFLALGPFVFAWWARRSALAPQRAGAVGATSASGSA